MKNTYKYNGLFYIVIFIILALESYFIYNFTKSLTVISQFEKIIQFLNVTTQAPPFYYETDNLLREMISNPKTEFDTNESFQEFENKIDEIYEIDSQMFKEIQYVKQHF